MNRNSKVPNVLIIGTGMYVCGRGTSGFGTVLPAVVQARAEGLVGEVFIAGTSCESVEGVQSKLVQLNARLGTQVKLRGYPRAEKNPLAYRKALDEISRPACAIIAVPDHLHASVATDVIQAGLHPLVVKPLASSLDEARRLTELAVSHRVYGAVEFHKRFDEANLLLRQTVADGRLGDLCYLVVEYSQRRVIREIFRSWIRHTNVFQYLGVHYVDVIYFATRAKPVRVLATGQPSKLVAGDLGGLDSIQALVEWQEQKGNKSFVSTILTNWIDPDSSTAMSNQKITVVGTLGRYQSDQKHRGVQIVTGQHGVEDINPYFTQLYAEATGGIAVSGYGPRSIRQFLVDVWNLVDGKCQLRELVTSRPSFQEALVSTAVIEAANRSLSQGEEWVHIDAPGLTPDHGV